MNYPVVVTTSKLLNTGVDVQTCKVIVLDSRIQSMTEFKQIIGRGTRIREDYGKTYFTILDFRQVTNLFADPEFDGEPVQSEDYPADKDLVIAVPATAVFPPAGQEQVYLSASGQPPRKYYINGVEVKVLDEKVQLFDKEGKLITQSIKEYIKQMVKNQFASLSDFKMKWNGAKEKSAFVKEMAEQGILLNELKEELGKGYDEYDLICHVAFDQELFSRKERVNGVKKGNYFGRYNQIAQEVIEALLDKYSDEGIQNLESMTVLKVNPFIQFGTPLEIVGFFGGKNQYVSAIQEIEKQLYKGP